MRSTGLDKTNRTPLPSYRSIAEQAYRDIDRLTAQRDELRAALCDLLDSPDLNLDELESETVAMIASARATLAEGR